MFQLIRRFIIVLVPVLFLQGTISAQTFWMQHAGGTTIDEATDVSIDGAGNTYVTGYFTSAAAFGSTTLSASGLDDVFLAKLGTNGLYTWAVKGGGANSERALSIKTDAAGNSYITGYFYGTATFGSQSVTATGAQDIFIVKYNSAGICQWAKSAGGGLADIGNGITVDPSGNVIVTGEFAGTATFGSTSLTSLNGSVDVFTTKLDANGNFLWAKKGSASLNDRGMDVDCDASGNIYITGQFSDTITFDVTHINGMLNAIFVVKYDPSGAEQWYRKIGGGAVNISNTIACDNTNGIYVAGDFQGTISFFGTTTTTLSATYNNRIFLAKYDNNGGLTWDIAESSDSPVSVRSVATNGTDCFITGNFKCTFDSYSDRYGVGLFNSSGYWDIFEAKYSSAGTWNMSRQLGGRRDQLCNGIAIDAAGNPHLAGSYEYNLVTPVAPSFYSFALFATNNAYGMLLNPYVPQPSSNCSDPNYNSYTETMAVGNLDIFVGDPIDPARLPMDYYYRTSCANDFVGVCINMYTGLDYLCGGDTMDFCQQGQLYASSMTSSLVPPDTSIGPNFTYLWSNNTTNPFLNVSTSGYYSVVMTTADGCYSSEDTIYVAIHSGPAQPTISDNVVINTNAIIPQPIVVCADSVILMGGNYGNCSVYWQGPAFDPNHVNTPNCTVDSSGMYTFVITDAFGCSVTNHVQVTLDHPLLPIDPTMVCMQDTDFNDSLVICDNTMLTIFPYDTISNPLANILCIDELTQIIWTITPSSNATIVALTDCNNNTAMTFINVHQTGWYTITETVIRTSACGNDTTVGVHSFYIEVLPAPPPGSLTLTISPNVQMCPGDSAILVVSGGSSYIWSNATTNDSLTVFLPGNYSVVGYDTVTNSFGCSSITNGQANVIVSFTPQPLILMYPSDGIICPGDSVELVASGNGLFSWQGPSGPVGGSGNILWVTTPGIYYCILSTPDSCQLLANTVTVQQYNTPSIQASPAAIICPGDSVTLTLTASSGSSVTWLPPLSGSALTQVITQPGIYSCTVLACNISTIVSVTIVPTTVDASITPLTSLTVCEGDSIQLGGNAGYTYDWQPVGSTNQTIYAYNDGFYFLTVTDSGGCSDRDSFNVTFVPNLLSPPTSGDTTICKGTVAYLYASGAPVITWYNAPSNGTVIGTGSPITINGLQNDTTFYLVTNDGICKSQPSPIHVFTEDCTPSVPNVFTPNGDGVNDNFVIFDPFAKEIHVWIYDRWGVLIYEWTDLNGSWNGTYMVTNKPVTDGVYYYIVEAIDISNTLSNVTGFVQLIREGPK